MSKPASLQVVVYSPRAIWGESIGVLLQETGLKVRRAHSKEELEQALNATVSSKRVLILTRFWPDYLSAYDEEFARIQAKHPDCPLVGIAWDLDPERIRLVTQRGINGYVLAQELDSDTLCSVLKLVSTGMTVWSGGLGKPGAFSNFPEKLDAAAAPVTSERHEGESDITPREWEIYQMLGRGLANRDIARQLHIGLRTVQMHVARLIDKLALHSRTEVAIRAALETRGS